VTWLVDTDILSLTSPASKLSTGNAEAWRAWVFANSDALHLRVITLMEVRFGIAALTARGATRRATELEHWMVAAETIYRGRLYPVTAAVAARAGAMLHRAAASGFRPSAEDALIAATADVHGSTVLSRNAKDMRALGVRWQDPLSSLPGR
jgi:hypothetical protein